MQTAVQVVYQQMESSNVRVRGPRSTFPCENALESSQDYSECGTTIDCECEKLPCSFIINREH